MSVFATAWAQQQRAGSTRAKAVLQVLADYADEDGLSFPSIPLLARVTEQSKRSVDRCLSQLEERGLIRIEPRFDDRGRRTSSRYYLLAPPEALRGPNRLHRPKPPERAKGVPEAVENEPRGMRQVGASPGQADGVDSAKAGATVAPTVTLSDSLDPPIIHQKENTARAREAPAPDHDRLWTDFWDNYPHPAGDPSKLAHEEWLAIVEAGGDPQQLAAAAKAYARGKRRSEWSVQACRWLREGRWCDWAKHLAPIVTSIEPKIASNVSASDRAWLCERWAALLHEVGAAKFLFVTKLVISDVSAECIGLSAPTAFLRDYAREQIGISLQRAFGRRIVIDLAQPQKPQGKVA